MAAGFGGVVAAGFGGVAAAGCTLAGTSGGADDGGDR